MTVNLDSILLGNPVRNWLIAIGAALLSVIALYAARGMVRRHVVAVAGRTATRADDILIEVLAGTRFFAVLAVAIFAGGHFIELQPKVERIAQHGVMVALLLQAAIWAQRAIVAWIRYSLEVRHGDAAATTTLSVVGFIAKVALWSVALLMVLGNLGFNVTGLVAGLGIGGVAVALAVQNIVGDMFASFVIAMDKPFVIGDFIVAGDVSGTVDRLGIKTTRLRSVDGEEVSMPNGELLKSSIRNFKRMQERRILFRFGAQYQTPPEKIERIPAMVREIIAARPDTRFERAHFLSYGESSLDFEVVYYVLSPDYNVYADAQHAINVALFRRFADAGIEFAYPTRTIYLANPAAVPDAR